MDPIVVILFVGLALIALVMVYTRTYLNIMGADEKCRATWKVFDAALARRGELVASLEAALAGRGGRGHEVLDALSRGRAAVDAAEQPADKIVASQALTQTLRELFAVTERSTALMTNPDLVRSPRPRRTSSRRAAPTTRRSAATTSWSPASPATRSAGCATARA